MTVDEGGKELYKFKGFMTNRVLDGIAAGIQDVLAVYPNTEKSYRKIFSIYVEIAQNIIFYSANRIEIPDDEAGYGTLTISEADGAITISGENKVTETQKNKLSSIFDHLDGMSVDEIKAAHQEKMMSQFDDSDSKGGGLGYYDIARKTRGNIQAEFYERNGALQFKITATIETKK